MITEIKLTILELIIPLVIYMIFRIIKDMKDSRKAGKKIAWYDVFMLVFFMFQLVWNSLLWVVGLFYVA